MQYSSLIVFYCYLILRSDCTFRINCTQYAFYEKVINFQYNSPNLNENERVEKAKLDECVEIDQK